MPSRDLAVLTIAVREHPGGASVTLRVVARAPRTALAGRHGDAVKLKVSAPPVDGAANAEVRRFLAGACGVGVGDVELLRGQRSRDKVVLIHDVGAEAVRAALRPAL